MLEGEATRSLKAAKQTATSIKLHPDEVKQVVLSTYLTVHISNEWYICGIYQIYV